MTTEALASGLYVGTVFHRRLRPRAHALKYDIYMLLIDLDEAAGLTHRLKWLSRGRFGLMSLNLSDFGDGSKRPLREQIEGHLAGAGIPGGGPIRLLTMPRILGYGFNPLSVFFCHDRDNRLTAILYEVSNTFGQRHSYLMPVAKAANGPANRAVRQSVEKQFHVSPFMDMDLTYRFSVMPPTGAEDEVAAVNITVEDGQGPMLLTGFSGHRKPLTDRNLMLAWIAHPLLTLKVVVGIHWEAILLILKGLRLRSGSVPKTPVTVGRPAVATQGG
jgi:DUF1365 family protein